MLYLLTCQVGFFSRMAYFNLNPYITVFHWIQSSFFINSNVFVFLLGILGLVIIHLSVHLRLTWEIISFLLWNSKYFRAHNLFVSVVCDLWNAVSFSNASTNHPWSKTDPVRLHNWYNHQPLVGRVEYCTHAYSGFTYTWQCDWSELLYWKGTKESYFATQLVPHFCTSTETLCLITTEQVCLLKWKRVCLFSTILILHKRICCVPLIKYIIK